MTDKTIRSIICDCCGKELIVDSPYPAKYAIEVRCINTGINTSGMIYMVALEPPFEEAKHFCDTKCLIDWASKVT